MKTKMSPTEQFESHYGVKIVKNKDNRTTSEDTIINSLYWLISYKNLSTMNPHGARHAALIEGCLIIDGKLDLYKPLEPNVTEEKFLWFTTKATESYNALMTRLGLEYLKERGVVE
jgi:hypothetical protein